MDKKISWMSMLGLAVLASAFSGSANAGWSKYGFTCSREPGLGRICSAPDGRVWSRSFHNENGRGAGGYSDRTTQNGKQRAKLSNAARVCAELSISSKRKFELPKKEDYERLIRYFPHTEESWGPKMTYEGTLQLEEVFNGSGGFYWTSSEYPTDSNYVYGFYAAGGDLGAYLRDQYFAVRCIEKVK
jgi:hypothetical protein